MLLSCWSPDAFPGTFYSFLCLICVNQMIDITACGNRPTNMQQSEKDVLNLVMKRNKCMWGVKRLSQ